MQLNQGKQKKHLVNTYTSQFNMFFSISGNTKSNYYPSYMGKASRESGNVTKNSACNRRELLIHCPVVTGYSAQVRLQQSAKTKLGKGSTLNRKGYYILLIPNPIHRKPQNLTKHIKQTNSSPSPPKNPQSPKTKPKNPTPNHCSRALLKPCSTF